MYSIVFMAALTQGAAQPAWQAEEARYGGTNFRHADAGHQYRFGRHGCHGGCYGGCYGGGYGGCSGGCYGGSGGCSGGCYGGYGGCSGGCYGGYGGCSGGYAYGCCGGGYGGGYGGGMRYVSGSMSYGGSPYMAGPVYYGNSPYVTGPVYYGGSPYMTGPVYYGAPTTSTSGYLDPRTTTPTTPDANAPGMDKGTSPRPGGTPPSGNRPDNPGAGANPPPQVRNATTATLIISLPADARLTIDDTLTRSTAAVRTFISPPLEPGRDYEYNLKAEAMRDGQLQVVTKRVTVRPGEETRVTLDFTGASASLK
jgi:uncharacterized protein (TIGR03000 family)